MKQNIYKPIIKAVFTALAYLLLPAYSSRLIATNTYSINVRKK